MKTKFTLKLNLIRNLFIYSALILAFASQSFAQTKHIVEVSNNKFTPSELVINVGDTIEWKNIQGFHNVNGKQTSYPSNPESFGNSTGMGWTYSHVFTIAGDYDYQCDPHVQWGMVGTFEVKSSGNKKYLVEVSNNKFTPKERTINVGDTVEWKNIQGFHNINGKQSSYLSNPESFGNSTGTGWTFSHVFTIAGSYEYQCDPHVNFGMVGNIEVSESTYKLTINFTEMNPHIGQMFKLYLVNSADNTTVETISLDQITNADFEIHSSKLVKGNSYIIKFYSDHNGNGEYDAPPTDHAWQLVLDNVTGDTNLNYAHNGNFTDIFNTTSINDQFFREISMYPNPATNKVTIDPGNYNIKDFHISVYNISGKARSVEIEFSNMIELNVNNLESGFYFIEVKNRNEMKTLKLLKR
ncbi:MAG: T9SS type A sorting domain-containing protein [Mariniphaga sp.]|nr:T9SS type A sorting domain-containing protein [Mariniphaga sp.]